MLALLALIAVSGRSASVAAEERGGLTPFPTGHYYPPPIADLHRPAFGMALREVYQEEIADAGSPRFDLRVGGTFGLLRWSGRRSGRGIQLDLIAGIDGQFDVDRESDNVGWDGNYGMQASAPLSRALAVKLAILHTSSHIGDELIERTGRRRIGYTREELVAGARRELGGGGGLSVYAEAGYGYELRDRELQEPWRLQAGADFDPTRRAEGPPQAWFVGVDLSATEERDWRVDVALKLGRTFRLEQRSWRLGLELYDGRPNLGEFFQDTEAHVALGVWLDF